MDLKQGQKLSTITQAKSSINSKDLEHHTFEIMEHFLKNIINVNSRYM